MKIETKFNVGDKVLYNDRVYTIACIHWRSDKNIRYTLEEATHCCSASEDQLSPAPRYSVGDKVWAMVFNNCYQARVESYYEDARYTLKSPLIGTFCRYESELYHTKEALLASITCHELT